MCGAPRPADKNVDGVLEQNPLKQSEARNGPADHWMSANTDRVDGLRAQTYYEMADPKPSPPQKNGKVIPYEVVTPQKWACTKCSFLNHPIMEICEMCQTLNLSGVAEEFISECPCLSEDDAMGYARQVQQFMVDFKMNKTDAMKVEQLAAF